MRHTTCLCQDEPAWTVVQTVGADRAAVQVHVWEWFDAHLNCVCLCETERCSRWCAWVPGRCPFGVPTAVATGDDREGQSGADRWREAVREPLNTESFWKRFLVGPRKAWWRYGLFFITSTVSVQGKR